MLQQIETGFYFKDAGDWTRDPAEAMDFISSTKAIDFCATHAISGVQLVLKFEEQHCDIVLPMVTDPLAHSDRARQSIR